MSEAIKIDQFLTNFATRYKLKNPVADFIAPPFKVKRVSDLYGTYGKGNQRVYNNKVSGREVAKETTLSVGQETYNCELYSLSSFLLDRIRDNTDFPINLEKDKTRQLVEDMARAREYRVAQIAGNSSIITQGATPSTKWDNVSSGTPVADILTAMATIHENSQEEANAIVMTLSVALKMIKTNEWKEYFKYTDTGIKSLFNVVSGLRQLGLEPMISGVFANSTQMGAASDPQSEQIWGDNVLVFHREPNPTLESRTLMYSPFTFMNRTERIVKVEERGEKFIMTEEVDELLVDAQCGYLFSDVLS